MNFSEEQKLAIKTAKEGKDIYIDAVIGAGKTTVLNEIANQLSDKEILYLTYNKLLKDDAKRKIRLRNVEVHNYHGFVYKYLSLNRFPYTNMNGIKDFVDLVEEEKIRVPQYDVILIDEYQDIDDQISDLIKIIYFGQNKKPQIIFVGDMAQKIYDKTNIDVVEDVLFKMTKDFVKIDLTNCFRISNSHAEMLSKIWKKKIKGINDKQKVYEMDLDLYYLEKKLDEYKNEDILILTPFRNNVILNQFINHLERKRSDKYNKENLYISISDRDSNATGPIDKSMIVTTFDGSKGLERELCVVFGWDVTALQSRSKRGKSEITKNLFLVAASRGKSEIIFIRERNELLNAYNFNVNLLSRELQDEFKVSDMFDFKYEVELRKCFELLDIKEIKQSDESEIGVISKDFNIDLSPVIGIYQEALFFNEWNYEKELKNFDQESPIVKYVNKIPTNTIEKQVLCIVACETNLSRYATQAIDKFIEEKEKEKLLERIKTNLNRDDKTQIEVSAKYRIVNFAGRMDALKQNVPFELKFVAELEMKHFLQIAMYVYMGEFEKGILWNTRTNKMFEVKIKNKEKFIEQVFVTVRKE